jgi:hypothetical protein
MKTYEFGWFESSEHFKLSAAERAAKQLASQARVETKVVQKGLKFFVIYKDRLLSSGEYVG